MLTTCGEERQGAPRPLIGCLVRWGLGLLCDSVAYTDAAVGYHVFSFRGCSPAVLRYVLHVYGRPEFLSACLGLSRVLLLSSYFPFFGSE
jgi:hypothetical protein